MKYVISKFKNNKRYSYYNEVFDDMNKAIIAMNSWMEFEASVLQYQLEINTLYTISINEYDAQIMKINTTKENIDKLKTYMNNSNLQPEEYLKAKEEVSKILNDAKQEEVFKYVLEGYEEFELPEITKDYYHVIAYKNNVMTEDNFMKTKYSFIDVNEKNDEILKEFHNFSIQVGEALNLKDKKHPIIVSPDKKLFCKCYLLQKKKRICSVILFPVSTKEVLV